MKPDDVFGLENAGWPALLVDAGGVIWRANRTAIKVFGSVVQGEKPSLAAVWSEGFAPNAAEFLAQWERAPVESTPLQFRVKNGDPILFSVAVCALAGDARKLFILQLLPETAPVEGGRTEFITAHKHKLECALQLARTMSLDFNNVLTGILGHTSLLLNQTPPNHPWRASLMEVEKAATRAGEIATDLGAFSRQEKTPRVHAAGNLDSVAQRAVETLQSSRPEKIEWVTAPARNLYTSKFDEPKLLQAFLRILENAVESVGTNGRITVQTRNVELAEAAQDRDLRLPPGTYVCAEISDNGGGIAPEILPRIFEPFFTTKKDGKHRGLGLALVYGILTNLGGGIAVSSQVNAGTSVRLYLPAEKKLARDRLLNPSDLNGTQTILMVDDEELMLTLGQTVLSTFGYRVLTANSGQKALEILARGDATVDLVITDLVMPSMSGRELAEHVNRLNPNTRVLRISGFVRQGNEEEETSYLQKPFSSQDLLVKVKRALA